ncbi:hypothetical protein ACWCSD_40230, partial [Nonomuraea sp. NPDC001684]
MTTIGGVGNSCPGPRTASLRIDPHGLLRRPATNPRRPDAARPAHVLVQPAVWGRRHRCLAPDGRLIVTMLSDGDAVHDAMTAAAPALRPGQVWAQM